MRKPRRLNPRHSDAIRRIASREGEEKYNGRIGDPIVPRLKPPAPPERDETHAPDVSVVRGPGKKIAKKVVKKTPGKKAASPDRHAEALRRREGRIRRQDAELDAERREHLARRQDPTPVYHVRPEDVSDPDGEFADFMPPARSHAQEWADREEEYMEDFARWDDGSASTMNWGDIEEYLLDRHNLSAHDPGYSSNPIVEIMGRIHSNARGEDVDPAPDTPPPPPPTRRLVPDEHRLDSVSLTRFMDGRDPANEVAEKMSGKYGPYWVRFTPEGAGSPGLRKLTIGVHNGPDGDRSTFIGHGSLVFKQSDSLVVEGSLLDIHGEENRGQGFGGAFQGALLPFFVRNGVKHVEVNAGLADGGSHWAQPGVGWDPQDARLAHSVFEITNRMDVYMLTYPDRTDEHAVLKDLRERLNRVTLPDGTPVMHIDFPTPNDIKTAGTVGHPNLGDEIMRGSNWYARLDL